MVLPGVEEERDPGAWRRLLEQEAVTLWNSVPALMEMLVESAEGGGERWRLPGSLRLVLLSGDRIALSLPERIWFLGKDVQLVSLGGPTENTIWNICHPITEVRPEWTSIPYGRPLANQRLNVLNEELEPCPVWMRGEIYASGMGLARG